MTLWGPAWDRVYIKIDDKEYIEKEYSIWDIDQDILWGGTVENYDKVASSDERKILDQIANSKKCIIRFKGDDDQFDYTIPDSDKAAIKDLLYVYDNYKP